MRDAAKHVAKRSVDASPTTAGYHLKMRPTLKRYTRGCLRRRGTLACRVLVRFYLKERFEIRVLPSSLCFALHIHP